MPNSWKGHKIIVVSKPGKANTELTNYRPITLISTLAKLFNKIVWIQLNDDFEARNIIHPHW